MPIEIGVLVLSGYILYLYVSGTSRRRAQAEFDLDYTRTTLEKLEAEIDTKLDTLVIKYDSDYYAILQHELLTPHETQLLLRKLADLPAGESP